MHICRGAPQGNDWLVFTTTIAHKWKRVSVSHISSSIWLTLSFDAFKYPSAWAIMSIEFWSVLLSTVQAFVTFEMKRRLLLIRNNFCQLPRSKFSQVHRVNVAAEKTKSWVHTLTCTVLSHLLKHTHTYTHHTPKKSKNPKFYCCHIMVKLIWLPRLPVTKQALVADAMKCPPGARARNSQGIVKCLQLLGVDTQSSTSAHSWQWSMNSIELGPPENPCRYPSQLGRYTHTHTLTHTHTVDALTATTYARVIIETERLSTQHMENF